jgi:hypothetical protein
MTKKRCAQDDKKTLRSGRQKKAALRVAKRNQK